MMLSVLLVSRSGSMDVPFLAISDKSLRSPAVSEMMA